MPLGMKSIFTLFSVAALALSPFARAETINLPVYGFSIEPLEAPVGNTTTTALATFLPATGGFAPNINVQIQPYPGSIADYAKLSQGQFDQMGWKSLSEKFVGSNEWIAEYSGPMQGNNLHFYARALSQNGKVYLVTGTASETQWPTVGPTIRQHVDSFKLK